MTIEILIRTHRENEWYTTTNIHDRDPKSKSNVALLITGLLEVDPNRELIIRQELPDKN